MKTPLLTLALLLTSAFGAFAQTANDVAVSGMVYFQTEYPPTKTLPAVPKLETVAFNISTFLFLFLVDREELDPRQFRLALVDESELYITRKDGSTDDRIRIGTVTLRSVATDAKKNKTATQVDVELTENETFLSNFSGKAVGLSNLTTLGEGGQVKSGTFTMVGSSGDTANPQRRVTIRMTLTIKKVVPFEEEDERL